jgi:hypothetical protein
VSEYSHVGKPFSGKPWLTDRQLDDLRDPILRQPNHTLLEANERSTADIIVERDGNILVRAPEWADDELIDSIVKSKHF